MYTKTQMLMHTAIGLLCGMMLSAPASTWIEVLVCTARCRHTHLHTRGTHRCTSRMHVCASVHQQAQTNRHVCNVKGRKQGRGRGTLLNSHSSRFWCLQRMHPL